MYFLAHEAQAVVPEAISGVKDGVEMQGIDQSKIVPLLTAALKEEIALREAAETKYDALIALLVTKGTITQGEADAL